MAHKLASEFQFLFSKMPFQVIFYPTSRCNAVCAHCYNFHREVETSREVELSLEEIAQLTKKMGYVKALTIGGGEPFLRPDIKEIVELFHNNCGVRYVSLHTNGSATKRVVDTVKSLLHELPTLTLILCTSVDGPQKQHDEIRGIPKGFERILDTLGQLEAMKPLFPGRLFMLTSTIFSATTQTNYKDTLRFVREKFATVKATASFIRGQAKDLREKNIDHKFYKDYVKYCEENVDRSVSPFSPMALKETLEAMTPDVVLKNHLEQRQTVPCQAGRKMLVIYEDGSVFPCETLKESFGNLRDVNFDLEKLLFSEKGIALKKKINPCKSCHCTWENAILPSLLYDPKSYPKILYKWFQLFILRSGRKRRVAQSAFLSK